MKIQEYFYIEKEPISSSSSASGSASGWGAVAVDTLGVAGSRGGGLFLCGLVEETGRNSITFVIFEAWVLVSDSICKIKYIVSKLEKAPGKGVKKSCFQLLNESLKVKS